jgi:hypothetical protein
MRLKLVTMALALCLGLAAAVPVAAQGGSRPSVHDEMGRAFGEAGRELEQWTSRLREHFGPGPGPAGGAPPFGERPLVSYMLAHRAELGLSPQQVEALERVRADFQREAIRRDADLRVAELDLEALRRQDPVDMGQVEAKIREIERLRADFRVGQVRAIEQGRAQLTAEQRERLRAMVAEPRMPRPPRLGSPRPPERM